MSVGNKTRRWARITQSPELAFMAELEEMDKRNDASARDSITKLSTKWNQMIVRAYQAASRLLDELEPKLAKRFEQMATAKLDSLPHLKGERGKDGKTPVKGVDYFDGKPGEAGKTPVADVDYMSMPTAKKHIEGEIAVQLGGTKSEEGGKPNLEKAMLEAIKKMNPALIARALETLQGKDRLDYEALKNRPGYDVGGQRQRTIHRGGANGVGGKETYEFDLSDLCDGVTKSFTIPANARIVAVMGTDSPAGFYRKTVDYTGSGTTTLTLTAEVAAPTLGASLSVLYVV